MFSNKIIRLFKRPATTVSGVLKQVEKALEAEGKWVQGAWLRQNNEGIVDPEAPLCSDGWAACLDGMVISTIFGLPVREEFDGTCRMVEDRHYALDKGTNEDHDLYSGVHKVLTYVAQKADRGDGDYIGFNDDGATTRTDVIGLVHKGYRRAQYVERMARLGVAV